MKQQITIGRLIEDDGTDTRPPLYVTVEVDVTVHGYTPDDPGVSDGPLEGSYPPMDGEVDFSIDAVRLDDDTPTDALERKSIEAQAAKFLEDDEDFRDEVKEMMDDNHRQRRRFNDDD